MAENRSSNKAASRQATNDSVSATPEPLPDNDSFEDPKDGKPTKADRPVTHPEAPDDPILLTPPPHAGAEPIKTVGYEPR